MIIQRAYKTELDPNNSQRTACLKHAGVARFAYNWGLARRIDEYKNNGKTVNAMDLHRRLNRLKKTDFPWMYEVSKCAPQEALRDLDRAFKNFFEGRARYPRFKSRKRGIGPFRLTGSIKVFQDAIQLPRLGSVMLKERGYLPTDAHILSATVSERGGRWFVSITIEGEVDDPKPNGGEVAGVDLGIKSLAVVSDGTIFENQKALHHHERKLRRQQRSLSRKKKGSNNRRKAVKRVQKTHARVSNIRRDAIHKATTWLAKNKSAIMIEDLNVSGMLKNHHLSKAISDCGWCEFRRQLEYKTEWYGSEMLVAPRWFPSTKICSRCGHGKSSVKLSDRTYVCGVCGLTMDRDLNSAINLKKLAVSYTESINACERGELWPSCYPDGETAFDEAGTERYIGVVLNG